MKLTELEPHFFVVGVVDEHRVLKHVNGLEHADGIRFLCPLCFSRGVATHVVTIRFALIPRPPRQEEWMASGSGYHNLTLTPSIHITTPDGCGWYGFVTAGEVTI
jgi:hypothetical protein